MTESTEYVVVLKKELDLYKNKNILKVSDVSELLEYWDVFKKYLNKSRFSYQIELCKWTHRGKEEKLYNKMEAIDEIIDWLDKLQITHKEILEKQSN